MSQQKKFERMKKIADKAMKQSKELFDAMSPEIKNVSLRTLKG